MEINEVCDTERADQESRRIFKCKTCKNPFPVRVSYSKYDGYVARGVCNNCGASIWQKVEK